LTQGRRRPRYHLASADSFQTWDRSAALERDIGRTRAHFDVWHVLCEQPRGRLRSLRIRTGLAADGPASLAAGERSTPSGRRRQVL